ncbi:O-antigen ligase family protein [Siminovitchia acidinfaciens]|uniref:O-antigen ligase family protein n=1 Tax=Siminovitchia acidinfaciens TaxID=2321395 RepID=UPI0013E0AEA0|nr:O-antigen ligase family protein [Siminovitchia acidinfaciens]
MAIFILYLSLNTLFSIDMVVSSLRLFQYLFLFLCFYISFNMNKKSLLVYEKALFFTGLFINIYSILEYISFQRDVYIPIVSLKKSRVVFLDNGELAFRLTGPFLDSAVLGGLLCVVFFYFFNKLIFNYSSKGKFILVLLLLVTVINILLTYSRSVWLGFAVTIIMNIFLILLLSKRKNKLVVLFVAFLMLFAAYFYLRKTDLFQTLSIRIFERDSISNQDHFSAFLNAMQMWSESPFIGQGMGTFSEYVGYYMMTHSMYLTFISEQGIIGLLLNMVLFCSPIVPLFLIIKRSRQGSFDYRAASVLFSLISFLINNIGYDYYNQYYFWILLGVAYTFFHRIMEEPSRRS